MYHRYGSPMFLSLLQHLCMLSVEAALLAIAFVSLPNLFFRAEFNVPLLLFAAASWRVRISTCAYLIVISWCIDLYRILTLLAYDDPHLDSQRHPLLIISTLVAFALKIALVVYLIIKEQGFRNALKPIGVVVNMAKAMRGEQ